MPENWKTFKLGDICKLSKNSIKPIEFDGEPYLGLEHIGQGTFLLEGIGSSEDVTSNKFRFESGDILYGKIRPYFKKVYRPCFSGICSTDMLVFKSKDEAKVNQSYLHQLIRTQEFTDKATETSSGTKMPRADWNSLKKLEYNFPSLPEQHAIASILSALDDKIENNLAMNKTLEAMAITLYKYWFVDFGPFQDDNFIDSEMGPIPQGWEVVSTQNLFSVKDGTHDSPKKQERGKYLITSKHIKGNSIDLENAYFISDEDFEKVNKRSLVESGDILMTMIGTVGVFFLVNGLPNYAIKNIGLFKTSEVPTLRFYLYSFFNSEFSKSYIKSQLAGSTQQYLTLKVLRNFPIISPRRQEIEDFNNEVEPLFDKLSLNVLENQTLTNLRDTLLPKLISGEVRIKDIEKTVSVVL